MDDKCKTIACVGDLEAGPPYEGFLVFGHYDADERVVGHTWKRCSHQHRIIEAALRCAFRMLRSKMRRKRR